MSYIFMNLNGEAEIIRELVAFNRYYQGLSLPLPPEVKSTMDSFFGGGGFVLFCDKVFGRFVDGFSDGESEMCWMDLANVAPHSQLAKTLFRAVAPGTPFVNFLEAISTPTPTFATKLRSGWKASQSTADKKAKKDTTEETSVTPAYTVDFPLSSFLQNSFRLMAESAEADLYTFTRSKIPGVTLVPFWVPPLPTREEPSSRQTLTSFPCTPHTYFLLRLLMYMVCRSERDGAAVLSRRQYRSIRSWFRYCEESVAWLFNRLPPTDFPFSSGVLTAHVQSYVTPSLPKTLSSKISVEDIQWTTMDVAATLLIGASFVVAHRKSTQPLIENNRSALYEPSLLAPIAVMVPFFTEMHIAIHKGTGAITETSSTTAVPAHFADDSTFKAGDEILYITQTLYRNSLIALRETTLSLDGFPRCHCIHFNNILELWLTLMNPLWRIKGQVGLNYISRHFEAYSFITIAILNLAVKSTMINTLDYGGVELFVKCLTQLGEKQFASLADGVHTACSSPDENALLVPLRRNRVLNWGDDTRTNDAMDIRDNQVCDKAAQLFVMIEQRCAAEEYDYRTDGYKRCLSAIEAAFPDAKKFYDKWRKRSTTLGTMRYDEFRNRRRTSTDAAVMESTRCLTEEEKRRFFKGTKRSCARYSARVRLATNNGRVHGGHHPSLKTTMYLELPFLIGPTQIMDAAIERVVDAYYSSLIPKCEVGHSMVLVNTDKYSCSAHAGNVGVWECSICEMVYGSCCRHLPVLRDGTQLYMKRNTEGSAVCHRCGEFINEGGICFASPQQRHTVYCPDCASRPCQAWSTRFLAAYSTWAVIVVVFLVYHYVLKGFLFREQDVVIE